MGRKVDHAVLAVVLELVTTLAQLGEDGQQAKDAETGHPRVEIPSEEPYGCGRVKAIPIVSRLCGLEIEASYLNYTAYNLPSYNVLAACTLSRQPNQY